MNADLATFMEDNPVDSEEDDEDDDGSLEAESRGNQEESKQ